MKIFYSLQDTQKTGIKAISFVLLSSRKGQQPDVATKITPTVGCPNTSFLTSKMIHRVKTDLHNKSDRRKIISLHQHFSNHGPRRRNE